MDELRIFAITWNTQTVRYNLKGCPEADFIDELSNKIKAINYHLVVIALQEDSIRDSPLLMASRSLIQEKLQPKYKQLKT